MAHGGHIYRCRIAATELQVWLLHQHSGIFDGNNAANCVIPAVKNIGKDKKKLYWSLPRQVWPELCWKPLLNWDIDLYNLFGTRSNWQILQILGKHLPAVLNRCWTYSCRVFSLFNKEEHEICDLWYWLEYGYRSVAYAYKSWTSDRHQCLKKSQDLLR